jgi:hypothetical protein
VTYMQELDSGQKEPETWEELDTRFVR